MQGNTSRLWVIAAVSTMAIGLSAQVSYTEEKATFNLEQTMRDLWMIHAALEAYETDHGGYPIPDTFFDSSSPTWFGFPPTVLTTPVPYLTELPVVSVTDEIMLQRGWELMGRTGPHGYTYIYDVTSVQSWLPGTLYRNNPSLPEVPVSQQWHDAVNREEFVVSAPGPDGVDSSLWGVPFFYHPTNGVVSDGDIYHFGYGTSSTNVDNWSLFE